MTEQFESNLVPVNPFHLAIEKHGEHIYLRVVERATTAQQEAIANGTPVVAIANKVKKIALEMFADANLMSGMRLEQDLGL